ncbi:hypothetical protein HID58_063671 [Brassica napus]|uniref:Uncharacterized protein n=1 Tax=Brassica napus TaxID=3708 RepID=A0ABQ7XEZ1_BRANA|nr:hypothetical protein HID58_063671 [Brassica napus]
MDVCGASHHHRKNSSCALVLPRLLQLHLLGLGQILVMFDVVFLVVGLHSIVLARLVVEGLTSMLSFIVRRQLHSLLILFCLPFLLCFLVSLQFSSLFAFLVALPFTMLTTLGLDNVFVCVYAMWALKTLYGTMSCRTSIELGLL